MPHTASSPPPSPPAGLRVGPYRLLTRIGEGGMGVVHLAQREDGPRVALKVLRPHIVGDDEARRRLAREVGSLSRIRSPRVAEIVDADPWAEIPYVATRYVPGLSLHDHVREEGPVRGAALARLGAQLAEALTAVHAAGVLHRDVKPSNVLMEGRNPVLIDFGLARLADDPRLTQTGWLLGTPGYLAPEILYGDDATPAADVHALAATIAYAGLGRGPFGRGPSMAVMDRVRRGEHDLDGLDPDLRDLLDAALDPEPARRPSLAVLMQRLGDLADDTGTRPRPRVLPVTEPYRAHGPDDDPAAATAHERPTRIDDPDAVATRAFDAPAPGPAPAPAGAPGERTPYRTPPPPPPGMRHPASEQPTRLAPPDAERAPYARPRPLDGHPDEGGEGGEARPRLSRALRTRRSILLLGLLAPIAGGAALAPWATLGVLLVGIWLIRASSLAGSARRDRTERSGPRRSDGVVAVLTYPWHLLVSALGTVVLLVWGLILAACAALIGVALELSSLASLGAAGVVLAVACWTGPGGTHLRRPLRRAAGRAAASVPVWIAAAVLLAIAGSGLAALAQSQGAQWAPSPQAPQRPDAPGDLLDELGRMLP